MISPVTNPTVTNPQPLSPQPGNDLGKDSFLKLLVAQLQHQDPLKPQDDSQFVAELAQFSNLEQTMGINTRLDTLSNQSQGLANAQVVNLVGKQATMRGSVVSADGSGSAVPVGFTLSGRSEQTTVVVSDSSGRAVRTFDIGAKDAGAVNVTWDGRDDSGSVQPTGNYTITVRASGPNGTAVSVSQETTGIVKSVSFDKGYAVLMLDNGTQAPVSDLIRIDSPPIITP